MAVRELVVENLSGIGPRVTFGFDPDKHAGSRSLLLFGENGSGKSSVVDALEFVLQARVRDSYNPSQVYEALRSHASDSPPFAAVCLDDGELVERQFGSVRSAGILPPSPHKSFSLAPIALRRGDLTRFWETPERQRQALFRGFFAAPGTGGWMRLGVAEERSLAEQREELKEGRRQALEVLTAPLGSLGKQVPLESAEAFDRFVRKAFPESFGRNFPTSGPFADPENRALFDAAVKVRRQTERILEVQGQLRSVKAAPLGQTALAETLSSAAAELSTAFSRVSPAGSFITAIDLSAGGVGDVSLRLRVELVNGRIAKPEEVLSEANLDLLALLLFTSILGAAAEKGQARFLVLDDVIQSVDAAIRIRLLEYLLERFSDWQLVLTTHDRLWREYVVRLFAAAGKPLDVISIRRWSLAEGPVLSGGAVRKRDQLAESVDPPKDAIVICSQAGLLHEELCHELSVRLPVKVRRKKGDRYTLGDLWPVVSGWLSETDAKGAVDEVARFAHLRNLVGAHHTEPGQTVTDAEAHDYAHAMLALWDAVNCESCLGWIGRKGTRWVCRCGKLTVSKSSGG